MKKLIVFLSAIALSVGLSAQTYSEGDNLLNFGVGLGSTYATGNSTIPPLSISFEHGITDKISVGALIGYSSSKDELVNFGGTWTLRYSYVITGTRGSYHFYTNDKIDVYGGALIGSNIATSSVNYDGPSTIVTAPSTARTGGFIYGIHVGARYYFSDSFGAFAELGYGFSYLTLGVTKKFYGVLELH